MSEEIQVQIGDTRYALSGGSFGEMVEKVKGVRGRRFRSVPNDKHWVLPVSLEEAESALAPFKLTSVGKALKIAVMDVSSMPTSPADALSVLQEQHSQIEQVIQDLRDVQFLLKRAPESLGGPEKTLVLRCARALLGWKG